MHGHARTCLHPDTNAMNDTNHLVVFSLDDMQFGLRLSSVERVARAVEITKLPKAPPTVIGIVNIQGRIVPVVNLRKRFGLPEKPITLHDHILVGKTSSRSVAFVVDNVIDIMESSRKDIVLQEDILEGMECFEGVAKLNDGMLLIHDLERLLSSDEERSLDAALARAAGQKGTPKK